MCVANLRAQQLKLATDNNGWKQIGEMKARVINIHCGLVFGAKFDSIGFGWDFKKNLI